MELNHKKSQSDLKQCFASYSTTLRADILALVEQAVETKADQASTDPKENTSFGEEPNNVGSTPKLQSQPVFRPSRA